MVMSREVLIATWGALFYEWHYTGLTWAGWAKRRAATLISLAYAGWLLLVITNGQVPIRGRDFVGLLDSNRSYRSPGL